MSVLTLDKQLVMEILKNEFSDKSKTEIANLYFEHLYDHLSKYMNDIENKKLVKALENRSNFDIKKAIQTLGWTPIKIKQATKKALKDLLPILKKSPAHQNTTNDLLYYMIMRYYYPDHENTYPGLIHSQFVLTFNEVHGEILSIVDHLSNKKDDLVTFYMKKYNNELLNNIKNEMQLSSIDETINYLIILMFNTEYMLWLEAFSEMPRIEKESVNDYKKRILNYKNNDKDTIEFVRAMKYIALSKIKNS